MLLKYILNRYALLRLVHSLMMALRKVWRLIKHWFKSLLKNQLLKLAIGQFEILYIVYQYLLFDHEYVHLLLISIQNIDLRNIVTTRTIPSSPGCNSITHPSFYFLLVYFSLERNMISFSFTVVIFNIRSIRTCIEVKRVCIASRCEFMANEKVLRCKRGLNQLQQLYTINMSLKVPQIV